MIMLKPLFLLVCLGALLPLAGLRGSRLVPAGLPAGWSRLVTPEMRGLVARHVIASRDMTGTLLVAALWLTMGITLSEPVLIDGEGGASANLAGRVLVLDMSDPDRSDAVRSAALDLAETLPDVPVALVAAAGDAFDIVPFTTDRQHIRRYLSVLNHDVMPVKGYEPQRAIAHAEAMLVRAEMIAGQSVLITGSETVPAGQLARDRWLRAVMFVRQGSSAPAPISALADNADARLVAAGEHSEIDADLSEAISSLIEDTTELSGQTPLQPWLIGLTCLLWWFQFRRPS
jgi:hypothetical protein